MLNFNGKFAITEKCIVEQGRKALFSLQNSTRNLDLYTETKVSLFDTYISSILSYGCEIWGFYNASHVEKLNTDFCKRLLCAGNNTPNYMVYYELGRYPLIIHSKLRIMKYWIHLLCTENLILKSLYDEMCINAENNPNVSSWVTQVKK